MHLDGFFGQGGLLSRALPGFTPREVQARMARSVAETLAVRGVLLAEAGTGTGKTLAYLVPALLSGTKVVVSTATKTLQAQIFQKDIPLIARALGRPVSAAVLKGRQNYLCVRRFERFRARPMFRFAVEAALYDRLEHWAGATRTGDRAELDDLPDDYGPWREVCSSTEACWGNACPSQEACHLLQHRRAAQKAQIVVVNHYLFFADLAVRTVSEGEVIPRYGAVIFDEAHHLESVATQYFGTQVSSYRVGELARDSRALAGATGVVPPLLARALEAVEGTAEAFWASLPRPETAVRLRAALSGDASSRLASFLDALASWSARLAPRQAESLDAENLYRRTEALRQDLARFGEDPEPGEVRWLEARGKGVFLQSGPVEVASRLAETLYQPGSAFVLTSATLRVGGGFAYVRQRLGVPETAAELSVESPFDYAAQGLLYVPKDMPHPNHESFPARAAARIAEMLEITEGRAFCLFTSHRVLRAVAETLRRRVPFPLLIQGHAPREILLRSFQEQPHSVLLGAQSFWEGVDVPGEALSAVIIDKIPFASPGNPVVEARIEQLRSRGESPFDAYQLPAAAMILRQGAGRLIRTAGDRGVVAVLDRRIVEKSYGRFLLRSLPAFAFTQDIAAVTRFFGEASAS
jgi:ATP-dependent DNA helicase DinG